MEHHGGRRGRPAADARQAPWPPADDPATAPRQLLGPGTGGYGVLQAGGGPARPVGPGSGPQPTLSRTPVRGFPPPSAGPSGSAGPAGPSGFDQPTAGFEQPTAGFQQAATPTQGLPVLDDPVPPASIAAGSGGAPGGRRAGRRGGSGRRSARMAWLALVAVVVVVAGGLAGYKFLYEPRVNAPVSGTLRLPTDAASSPGFDQSLGKWQHIGARTQDPAPLTLAQLFPPQFELDGSSYIRTAAAVSKDCTQAVFGANLQASLTAGHCSQVLRASYISGDGKMMGTVGVANLIGSNAAQKAGQTTGPQQIIAPLAAQKGPTSKLGHGTGVVQAEIKGHYLILMWAEFTNLKSPSTTAQRSQLEQFAASLVTGSANINLSTRMLTGKS